MTYFQPLVMFLNRGSFIGCMIVQILDYRPQNHKDPVLERAEQTRVVLHPSSESLWADICSLNQRYGTKWTDMDALEVEARVLVSSPLHALTLAKSLTSTSDCCAARH
jgi:hypothetical protein